MGNSTCSSLSSSDEANDDTTYAIMSKTGIPDEDCLNAWSTDDVVTHIRCNDRQRMIDTDAVRKLQLTGQRIMELQNQQQFENLNIMQRAYANNKEAIGYVWKLVVTLQMKNIHAEAPSPVQLTEMDYNGDDGSDTCSDEDLQSCNEPDTVLCEQ